MGEQTMPFGKHRGQPLTTIPDGYLRWLARLEDLRPALRREVQCELWARKQRKRPRVPVLYDLVN